MSGLSKRDEIDLAMLLADNDKKAQRDIVLGLVLRRLQVQVDVISEAVAEGDFALACAACYGLFTFTDSTGALPSAIGRALTEEPEIQSYEDFQRAVREAEISYRQRMKGKMPELTD